MIGRGVEIGVGLGTEKGGGLGREIRKGIGLGTRAEIGKKLVIGIVIISKEGLGIGVCIGVRGEARLGTRVGIGIGVGAGVENGHHQRSDIHRWYLHHAFSLSMVPLTTPPHTVG